MKKKITALCSAMIVLSICFSVFSANGVMKTDITTATAKNYNGPKTETTTSNALGGIVNDVIGGLGSNESASDKVDSVLGSIEGVSGDIDSAIGGLGDLGDSLGGLGDSFGGIGDSLGGIGGGGLGSGLGDSLSGALGDLGSSLGSGLGSGSGSGSAVKTTAPATTSGDIGIIIPVPAATQSASQTQAVSTSAENSAEGETVDYAATANPYTKPTSTFSAGDEDETIKWLQWIFVYTGYGLKDDGITGVLDEDTVAVVKKLQKENKFVVDGNITEDVIKAAEVLYYQSILGDDVSAIEVPSDATTGVNPSSPVVTDGNGDSVSVILLIIILVIIWVLAIGGIILLFVFKKKKAKTSKNADVTTNEAPKSAADKTDDNGIKSLSDLFEEAENKDK